MVELTSDDMATERLKDLDFQIFDLRTENGMLEAIDHMHKHGPLVCIHSVTAYQSENLKSSGIIHGTSLASAHEMSTQGGPGRLQTHAVCIVGLGVEDMAPFLSYQNSVGKEVQKDGFGRMLYSSVLQAVGLFVDKDHERPLKKRKV